MVRMLLFEGDQLHVYIEELKGKPLFTVYMGYSFAEIDVQFNRISELPPKEIRNLELVSKHAKADWLLELFNLADKGNAYTIEQIFEIKKGHLEGS